MSTSPLIRLDSGADPAAVRALVAAPPDVDADVRRILARVRSGGDAAVLELTAELDRVSADSLRVGPEELEQAVGTLDPAVLSALRMAIENVGAVARAQVPDEVQVKLPQGQVVEVAELPVRRAAAYVPAGRAPYPSTVVMCALTADAAGVEELAVCAPPARGGGVDPVILAACALCGVREVYRMGGAQAIAALAYGTETVPAVDVVVGPGSPWVQEAKRQVTGLVGIDGVAGPSELVVVAGAGADTELVALDLLAQAEHGPGSLICAVSPEPAVLDGLEDALTELGPQRSGPEGPAALLVPASDARAAVTLADGLAPEHLELVGADVEALAGHIRSAGCLFVGRDAATAFGDYMAGSNHVLPTGGAARYASGLSPAVFRRRMARVSLPEGAAGRLAPAAAALARAEGFPVHAESMERRAS